MFHPPTHLQVDPSELAPISCPVLKRIKTTVIVTNVEFKERTPPRVLHELVKDMLRGLYVQTKSVINLEDFDIDIKYAVVEDIKPDSVSAGLVASKTALEIVGVQTVRHYKSRLQDQYQVPLGGLEEVRQSF